MDQPKAIGVTFEASTRTMCKCKVCDRALFATQGSAGATTTCVTYVSIRFTVILYVMTKYNIDCCPRCSSRVNTKSNHQQLKKTTKDKDNLEKNLQENSCYYTTSNDMLCSLPFGCVSQNGNSSTAAAAGS